MSALIRHSLGCCITMSALWNKAKWDFCVFKGQAAWSMDRLPWQLVIQLSAKLKSNNRKSLANKAWCLSVTIICLLQSGFGHRKTRTPSILCYDRVKQGCFLFKNYQTEKKKTSRVSETVYMSSLFSDPKRMLPLSTHTAQKQPAGLGNSEIYSHMRQEDLRQEVSYIRLS